MGRTLLRYAATLLLALAIFAVILLLFGKDPLRAYADIFRNTLGSRYGISEVIVKLIPLLFCALAVLLPARIGLVNVGGEGQLYMGSVFRWCLCSALSAAGCGRSFPLFCVPATG